MAGSLGSGQVTQPFPNRKSFAQNVLFSEDETLSRLFCFSMT